MIRFEIQELLTQSDWGVTYLAYDKQDERDVALRRYLPLGRNGALSEKQIREYDQRCARLVRIEHANLRAVVHGSVDRVDATPYLVTEWVDGLPLTDVLGQEKLDPARARDLARSALQVSLVLSKTFGEQAIWVDTDPKAIIVGSEGSDRGFTFWVCMARWFNVRPEERKLSSVATMVEKLTGWDTKMYNDDSAGGFGGWVKSLKKSTDLSLEEALEQLDQLGGKKRKKTSANREKNWVVTPPPSPKRAKSTHPKPKPAPSTRLLSSQASPFLSPVRGVMPAQPVHSPTNPHVIAQAPTISPTQKLPAPPVQETKKSSGVPTTVWHFAILMALALGGLLWVKNGGQEWLRERGFWPGHQQNPAVVGGDEAENPEDGNLDDLQIPILSPHETEQIKQYDVGNKVKLKGVVVWVSGENDDKEVQLFFDDPEKGTDIRAIAERESFEGAFSPEMFKPLVGEEVVIEGHVVTRPNGGGSGHMVMFTDIDQISPNLKISSAAAVGQNPPDGAQESPADTVQDGASTPAPRDPDPNVYLANEHERLRETKVGRNVYVRGVLRDIRRKPGRRNSTIWINFDVKDANQAIAASIVVKNDDRAKVERSLREYVNKEIIINGRYGLIHDTKRAQVEINNLNQVKLYEVPPATKE